MIPLLVSVFIASLLGSTHCAGMCGAFVVFAVGGAQHKEHAHPVLLHGAYNLGRLIVYTVLGLIAGAAGATIELGGSLAGVQHGAAIGAGTLMIGFGIVTLLRVNGVRVKQVPLPRAVIDLAAKGHRAAAKQPPILRALITGLLTTLLPCGWMYMFVVGAAGTGDPLLGAAVMAFFWLGTLPIMVALGATVKKLTGPLASRLPAITACAVVAIGVWTIVDRSGFISSTERWLAEMEYAAATGQPMRAPDDSGASFAPPCHTDGHDEVTTH